MKVKFVRLFSCCSADSLDDLAGCQRVIFG